MREILSELHGEVTSGYEDTLRKLVVRQTLVKPNVKGLTPDPPLPSDPLGLDYSVPWHKSVVRAKEVLNGRLYLLHPVMQGILRLWEGFKNMLILDMSTIRSKGAKVLAITDH